MARYVGLDVSVKTTAICVMDGHGEIILEATAESDPKAINEVLRQRRIRATMIGLESGPLSQWLYKGLRRLRSSVVCIEARRMKTFAAASRAKTDRIDARMIAEALRVGAYQPVHIKSLESQEQRMLLVHRSTLLRQARRMEQVIRGTLRPFGLKVGNVGSVKFEDRVLDLVAKHENLMEAVEPLLATRSVSLAEYEKMDNLVIKKAKADPVVQLLMTMPAIGPIVGLAFKVTVDDPARYAKSAMVAAHLGLTPRIHESGETARAGGITRAGDRMLRALLFLAAENHLLTYKGPSYIQDWGRKVAERRGTKRAIIAVARRMVVVLHRMWVDGSGFDPQPT